MKVRDALRILIQSDLDDPLCFYDRSRGLIIEVGGIVRLPDPKTTYFPADAIVGRGTATVVFEV